MKSLSAPALAALAGGSICIVQLVALEFPVPIYLNTSTWDLTWQRRYNLLTYSEQIDLWSVGGGVNPTFSANSAYAPDGTLTADLITFPAGGTQATSYVLTDPSALADTYVLSVYATTSTPILTVGGAVLFSEISYTVVNVGGGWYRHIQVAVVTSAMTQFLLKRPTNGAAAESYHVWGAQLEPGEVPSTYTRTTTTPLTDLGQIYKGAYGLGSISSVSDKPGEISGISLELAAGSPAIIALALDGADEVQGTVCTIRTAIIDTATYQILDAPIEWSGTLDTMSIGEDGNSAVVSVSAESKAVDLLRGTPSMYVDEEQTLINPTDRAFKYVVDQVDKPLIWPSRGYYQQ